MARTVVWVVAGCLVGGGLVLGVQSWIGRGDDAVSEDQGDAPAPVPRLAGVESDPPAPLGGPAGAAAAGVSGESAAAASPTALLPPAVPAVLDPRAAFESSAPGAGTFHGRDGYAFAVARAEEALARGDERQAVSLLRGLIQQAMGKSSVDLSEQAMTLLAIDDDPLTRKECLRYLGERGEGDRAFADQLARARVLATADDSESQKRAWDELSIAYEVASDDAAREQVVPLLDDYVRTMVFSGRFSPVLSAYPVKAGDTLLDIAVKHRTTVEAIKRLNSLASDVIHPRTRLRILPGGSDGTKIYVDKRGYRLWLTIDGRVLLHRRVGLGRDNRTPVGDFVVKVKTKDPTWYPGGGQAIPAGDPRNVLGSRWLGFEETEDFQGFGIHATSNLADIGRESSSGCVRLLTEDMELLFDFVPYGTPVSIRE